MGEWAKGLALARICSNYLAHYRHMYQENKMNALQKNLISRN
jgi:hypothetical protein